MNKKVEQTKMPYESPWSNKRDDITFCTMLFRMPSENTLAKIKFEERKFEDFYLASLETLVQKFGKVALWCDRETADFIEQKGLNVKKKCWVLSSCCDIQSVKCI